MSNSILNRVWDNDTITNARDRLLLVSLADQANDDGICWPGIGSLTKRMGCSRPTVIKAIRSLESRGAIIVCERPYKAHRYIICVGMDAAERHAALRLVREQVGAEPRKPQPLPSKQGLTSKDVLTRVVKTGLPLLVKTGLPEPSLTQKDPSKGHYSGPAWELPEGIDSDDMAQAWFQWFTHYRELTGKNLSSFQGDLILAELAPLGEARAIAAINHSIKRGWKSIHEQDGAGDVPAPSGKGQADTEGMVITNGNESFVIKDGKPQRIEGNG